MSSLGVNARSECRTFVYTLTWLERAERNPLLLLAKTNPRLDPLRSDPRFQDLIRRIGFPEE